MSAPQNAPKSLQERIDQEYAPAWKPSDGESLVGFVESVTMGNSDYGDYPIVTVVKSDGTRLSVHAFHSVVRDALIDAAPGIGEEIAFKFDGRRYPKGIEARPADVAADGTWKGKGKDPRYASYKILVEREPEDIWSKMKRAPKRGEKTDD